MSIRDELKRLKKEEAKLAKKKSALTAKIKKAREQSASLAAIVTSSGYKTPRALIKALQEISGTVVRRKVRRRKEKAAPAIKSTRTEPAVKRRKRTKITAALRDAIKKEIKSGVSKNKAAKRRGLSYAVITKAVTGAYDKLK